MKATINFNHIEEQRDAIEEIMAEVESKYVAAIAAERKYTPEPYTYKTLFLRRTKTVTPKSYDDYWAEVWNDKKRFPNRQIDADERIKIATTEYNRHGWVDDDGFGSPVRVLFDDLRNLCYSLYNANDHRRKMYNKMSEAMRLRAASVTLSDTELANCDYYRRMVTPAD